MDEEHAYTLAQRIATTPGYDVLEVRRAWSAAVAWQVEAVDRRTDERLLLLSEDQFDSRLLVEQVDNSPLTHSLGSPLIERAAAHHS
jgi:hypothetical protein